MTHSLSTAGDAATSAHRELLLLGQQAAQARALLAALELELIEASARRDEGLNIEKLVEANRLMALALLAAQADARAVPRSEQQRVNLELRETNAQLVIAALSAQGLQASAEHALGQQRNILALVAHELRNPLTPISMIASRLVRVPAEELPHMQALIESQVQHMSRLVDDLLDVSRASTGKLRLERHRVDMAAVINEAAEVCRPMMTTHQLVFSADLPVGTLAIYGDPVRLAQVLGNLLGNAAKYTPAGGVVALSVVVQGHQLALKISDTGIGITAEALPFIFEPFVQDEHAVGFNGAGLGIGLTVVRELVEAHNGTVIGFSAGSGKGSEFVVTLPLLDE
ncbi:MAG: sensor histidine kinase [Pseudomonas sp.]